MLKLLKYEFRKGLTALLIMLGVTAALEGYFLYGLTRINVEAVESPFVVSTTSDPTHALLAAMLLIWMALAMSIVVLVRGVTSYSGELKHRSSYLIFMTPNSTLKIVGSKFLFTFLLALLAMAVYGALGVLDVTLLLRRMGALEEFLREMNVALADMGIHLEQIVFAGVLAVAMMILSALSLCAVAYLAVTLSHTFFRDKSWRWLVAVLFYWLITQGISVLNGLFASPFEQLVIAEAPGVANISTAYGIDTTPDLSALLLLLVPNMLVSVGTVIASLFGCSWMLSKKVSL